MPYIQNLDEEWKVNVAQVLVDEGLAEWNSKSTCELIKNFEKKNVEYSPGNRFIEVIDLGQKLTS